MEVFVVFSLHVLCLSAIFTINNSHFCYLPADLMHTQIRIQSETSKLHTVFVKQMSFIYSIVCCLHFLDNYLQNC